LDFELIAESVKLLADELGSIVMDDSSRHTKAVYHVMLDKFDHVRRLYFFQGWLLFIWRGNRL